MSPQCSHRGLWHPGQETGGAGHGHCGGCSCGLGTCGRPSAEDADGFQKLEKAEPQEEYEPAHALILILACRPRPATQTRRRDAFARLSHSGGDRMADLRTGLLPETYTLTPVLEAVGEGPPAGQESRHPSVRDHYKPLYL